MDRASQRRKFLSMMQEIMNRIDTPEESDALLWAMEEELGSELTPETRPAWRDAYLLLAQLMARGASRAAAGPRS